MGRLAALLLLAAALRAQSVDGTLADRLTHSPLPDVIVTLLGPARYNATTDDAGAFHFPAVQAGKYVINIVKSGYVLPPSRSRIQVDSDSRLAIEMDRLPVVEGRVRYPDGRPAPRAPVWLTPYPSGSSRPAAADAGGRFFFEDVKPGSYTLSAAAAPGDPTAEGEIWAATWFPSTVDRSGAETLHVAAGVPSGYEVRLRSLPARRIRGVVRDETGRPVPSAVITLSGAPGQPITARAGEDGAFDLVAWDGGWRLLATHQDSVVERRGFAAVAVARHDVENVEIRILPPFSVPIVVEGLDEPKPGAPPNFASVALFRLDGPAVVSPAADRFRNVYPGRYNIQPMGGAPGFYVDSVKLGEIETYGRPIDIWDGSLPIRVTYKSGAPSLHGVVDPPGPASVVMLNADESLTAEGTRVFTTRNDGSFQLSGLAPGDYYILALEGSDPSPAHIASRRALQERAEKIHLDRGAALAVQLKLTALPE